MTRTPVPASGLRLRQPVEADHTTIVRLVDEWGGGRRIHERLPRLWFQHFTGSSFVAETGTGRLAGFLVGFVSPDHPEEAYIHMVAVDPNLRQRGIGRTLYDAFFELAAERGARRVRAVTWPGDRGSVAFHVTLGFRAEDGAATQSIYGLPAYPDYDFDGEDRVVFVRELTPG